MSYQTVRVRQVVDWGAAIRAGFIAGALFLLTNLILFGVVYGVNGWVLIRQFASVVLGEGILSPPATFDSVGLVVGLLTHFALSIVYALLIAYVVHRGGLISGIVGGALLGLAFYTINVYTLTLFRPWLYSLNNGVFVLSHLVFGALAGGVYEALEEEVFIPIEQEDTQESTLVETEVQP